ncbi:hypothetical protein HDU67_004480 [Dinochytrium kinnereticum]|nr:hypothetical protein HDU67_004480 [Dinochytrium kinnereticum]
MSAVGKDDDGDGMLCSIDMKNLADVLCLDCNNTHFCNPCASHSHSFKAKQWHRIIPIGAKDDARPTMKKMRIDLTENNDVEHTDGDLEAAESSRMDEDPSPPAGGLHTIRAFMSPGSSTVTITEVSHENKTKRKTDSLGSQGIASEIEGECFQSSLRFLEPITAISSREGSSFDPRRADLLDRPFPFRPLPLNEKDCTESTLLSKFPGLYKLLEIYRDSGTCGLVDKIIISQPSLRKLCNDLFRGSYRSVSNINISALESLKLRFVGVYGSRVSIATFLFTKGAISQNIHVRKEDSSKNLSLAPGLYLLIPPPVLDVGYIIHWPEEGAFSEAANGPDQSSSPRKRNMINMQRFLTKLSERVVCVMTRDEFDSFDFSTLSSSQYMDEFDQGEEFDEENEEDIMEFDTNEFLVTKNQCRTEHFAIFPGFKMMQLKASAATCSSGKQLNPLIASSDSHQTVLVPSLLPPEVTADESRSIIHYPYKVKQYLTSIGAGGSRFKARTSSNPSYCNKKDALIDTPFAFRLGSNIGVDSLRDLVPFLDEIVDDKRKFLLRKLPSIPLARDRRMNELASDTNDATAGEQEEDANGAGEKTSNYVEGIDSNTDEGDQSVSGLDLPEEQPFLRLIAEYNKNASDIELKVKEKIRDIRQAEEIELMQIKDVIHKAARTEVLSVFLKYKGMGDFENFIADTKMRDGIQDYTECQKEPMISQAGEQAYEFLREKWGSIAESLHKLTLELKDSWIKTLRSLEMAHRIITKLDLPPYVGTDDDMFCRLYMQAVSGKEFGDIISNLSMSKSDDKSWRSVAKKIMGIFAVSGDAKDLEETSALKEALQMAISELGLWESMGPDAEALVIVKKWLLSSEPSARSGSISSYADKAAGRNATKSLVSRDLASIADKIAEIWSFGENVKNLVPREVYSAKAAVEAIVEEKVREIGLAKKIAIKQATDTLERIFKTGIKRTISRFSAASPNRYEVEYRTEVPSPECISYAVYQTDLTQDDRMKLELQGDLDTDPTSFVACPVPLPAPCSFILTASSQLLKVFQCSNKKLLVFCREGSVINLYFGNPEDIDTIIRMAYHDGEGLLVLYEKEHGTITTYKFDEARNELAPDLSNLVFAQNTSEEICFIERTGRTRLFNLVTLQFRPAMFFLPPDESTLTVLKTPGGECLVCIATVEKEIEEIVEKVSEVAVAAEPEDITVAMNEGQIDDEEYDRLSTIGNRVGFSVEQTGPLRSQLETHSFSEDESDSVAGSDFSIVGDDSTSYNRCKPKKIQENSQFISTAMTDDGFVAAELVSTAGIPEATFDPKDNCHKALTIPCTIRQRIEKKIVRSIICKVYFSSKLGQAEPLEVPMPDCITEKIARNLTVSVIHKKQIHFVGIDENDCVFSLLLHISVEKNQWQFVKKDEREAAVLVVEPNRTTVKVKSNSRARSMKCRVGDSICVNKQSRTIIAVFGRTIRIDAPFNIESAGEYEFDLLSRNTSNALLDCLRDIYEKYPVRAALGESDSAQERALRNEGGGLCICILDGPTAETGSSPSATVDASASFMSMSISSSAWPAGNSANQFADEVLVKMRSYLISIFNQLKLQTNKECAKLFQMAKTLTVELYLDGVPEVGAGPSISMLPPPFSIGRWIMDMFCLLPLQIATTRANQLLPLKDGIISREIDGLDVEGITKKITFGWLESIFAYCGNRKIPVKVLSAMGLQSTGKSYMMNHITGTHFDGNAMRCTEGVWMSLSLTPDALYVSLDFEGLGSVERSPQEDMLLSLFNAATSHLILYKTNFSLGRSMKSLFQMFQDGARLFEKEKNDRLFKGQLFVQINDVPKRDEKDIVQEFRSKIGQIVDREGEDNFLSRLFQMKMNIEPWPLFNETNFYKKMSVVTHYAKNMVTPYSSAVEWKEDVKVLLAKLMICDWGSIDDNLISSRILLVASLLPKALLLGLEEEDPYPEPLRSRDTEEVIVDTGTSIEMESLYVRGCTPRFEITALVIPNDAGLKLPFDTSSSLSLCLLKFHSDFSQAIGQRQDAEFDDEWVRSFSKYIFFFVDRRVRRVEAFVEKNLERFPESDPRIANVRLDTEKEIGRFKAAWTLCARHCHDCELFCLEREGHTGDHNCGTDHRCHHLCEYVESHSNEIAPQCKAKAGHRLSPSGRSHACSEASHFCGEPCKFENRRHCQHTCSLEVGHLGDEHLCKARAHFCGEPCSLDHDEYTCRGTCVVACEDDMDHERHFCENKGCPIKCEMPNCVDRKSHRCEEDCKSPGICDIQMQPEVQESFIRKKFGAFQFTKHIQIGKRLKCFKMIPAGLFTHDGAHSHCENDFHYCDVKCPNCEYFCNLPHNHNQEHTTSHGNMTQTTFTCLEDDFEYDNEKFSVGDSGVACLCSMFCKQLGRHTHIDYCRNPDSCIDDSNIRHIQKKLNPEPELAKDFISHSLFWKRTGFQDPNSKEEQEQFALCDAECPGDEHKDKSGIKSNCSLPLFHRPLQRTDPLPKGIGYISVYHNNRYGAVLEACCRFVDQRWSGQVGSGAAVDTLSLIPFDHAPSVAFANGANFSSQTILSNAVHFNVNGGTDFDRALEAAYNVIVGNWDDDRIPVVLFLSDGECGYSETHLRWYCDQSPSLSGMATTAMSYHGSAGGATMGLGGFYPALDEVQLSNHFVNVAQSLMKAKPSLISSRRG